MGVLQKWDPLVREGKKGAEIKQNISSLYIYIIYRYITGARLARGMLHPHSSSPPSRVHMGRGKTVGCVPLGGRGVESRGGGGLIAHGPL